MGKFIFLKKSLLQQNNWVQILAVWLQSKNGRASGESGECGSNGRETRNDLNSSQLPLSPRYAPAAPRKTTQQSCLDWFIIYPVIDGCWLYYCPSCSTDTL